MGNDESKFPSTDISAARIEEVNKLHVTLLKTLKKAALYAFKIGKELRDIWGRLDEYDSWPEWCKNNLVFTVKTANNYLRIYENYKDNPNLLTDQTITDTLKLLSSPRKEKETLTIYGDADKRPETSWEQYFELPPLGRKVKLNNYRFEQPNPHELYLIRRGLNYPVKIAEVHASGSDDGLLKTAYQGMMENVQVALETYYQEVERLETLHGGKKT